MATIALFKWLNARPSAARRTGRTGPRRLARAARRRLGEGVCLLRRALRLAESGRRHRCGRHVPAVLRRRRDDRRHVHQASDGCRSRSGFTISTLATSTRRRSARRRGGGQILSGPTAVPGGSLDRPVHGPAGRHLRARGKAEPQRHRIFRARRIARSVATFVSAPGVQNMSPETLQPLVWGAKADG